ncbi:MAG: 5'-methylthioadenosine/adenosylhomocysteine nucleosidase [Firmicutes bacterium]|nr:5'-methylthioadenosine/adenosylhomocysteine nucleosidase [Bacillota bacterium]
MERCIAVIAAEEQELAGLEEFLIDAKRVAGPAGCVFLTGKCGSVQVVAMRCGIGKVNAAIGTQVLIDAYHPQALVNVGAAGALAPGLKVFDLVVSQDTVQHDMNVKGLGYEPGIIPDQDESYFKADGKLVQLAEDAGKAEGLEVHIGRIASGDLFVSTQEDRQWIYNTFNAMCAEMEGASVAHTCWRNQVPFVIVRSMSDTADEAADVSYAEFSAKAALQAVQLLKRMIIAWEA